MKNQESMDKDERTWWDDIKDRDTYTAARKLAEFSPVAGKLWFEVWCPQTTKARLWRMIFGG